MVRMELSGKFQEVYDIERLISRIVLGSNCRELIALKISRPNTIFKRYLRTCGSGALTMNNSLMDELDGHI